MRENRKIFSSRNPAAVGREDTRETRERTGQTGIKLTGRPEGQLSLFVFFKDR